VLLPKKAVLGRVVKWREKRNANLGTITTSEWEYQRAASEGFSCHAENAFKGRRHDESTLIHEY